ncbi:MAG TPA: helicase-associated domain-containing protein [Anaerolineales bacterium]|nr:helicase-associated domain-containing protein [Anaerolineales bacterium]
MPSLGRTLQDVDLGRLRILAELWGLNMPAGRASEAAPTLVQQMLEPGLAVEIVEALPSAAREALQVLLARGGRETMGELALRFGPLRPVGPGRREREQPWRDPEAALDGLLYRGLIGRAFFETPTGPEEFAFVPDELQTLLADLPGPADSVLGPVAAPTMVDPAGGAADDATTLLAALRRRPAAAASGTLPASVKAALQRHLLHPESLALLITLFREAGLLVAAPLRPDPAQVRHLLAHDRLQVESRLLAAWRATRRHNDLAHTPGLTAPKGKWPNEPATTRAAVLGQAKAWKTGVWYALDDAVGDVRRHHPAFLRPGGDLESWLLQDAHTGRWLSGLADWEMVEGALLRHMLCGPLHWLGVADLGREADDAQPTSFRLRCDPLEGSPERVAVEIAAATIRVLPDGQIVVPRRSPLAHRYQVARFADWLGRERDEYRYRLTPRALSAAAAQGLDARRVAALLETATDRPLPEALQQSLKRWSQRGEEARLETALLLRVKSPEVLRQLRADPSTGRFLVEILGPTLARIRVRDRQALLVAAAKRGLLVEAEEQ